MPGVYDDERPFDSPGSSQGDAGPVIAECGHCGDEVDEEAGEHKVVFTHRVEGRAVGTDEEFICNRCLYVEEK